MLVARQWTNSSCSSLALGNRGAARAGDEGAERAAARGNNVRVMDSLRGQLLIASPVLVDPNFHRTVLLIAEHTEEGAMGLVLNRPAETLVADAVPDLSELADAGAPVYVGGAGGSVAGGGPVASDSVIVLAEFDEPSLAGVLLDDDLGFVGSASADLDEVAGGGRRARVFAGHSGWGPGQLESELEEESWIVEPPRREEIFSEDPESLWAAVLRRKGREYALLSTMPPDPSVN